MKKAFLLAIAAAVVFPMISMADEPAAKPEKTEKTQKERKAPQGPTLFKFDANKDGVVTKDELPADNKFIEGMFNHTDADKDGKVTKEEEAARKAELKKRYEQYKAKAGDRPRRPQPPKGPRPQGQRPQGPRGPQQGPTLFKFDANKDGVVTKDELPKDNKFVEGMFDRTDADKDGKVTKEEETARKAELQKRYEQRRANAGDRPRHPQPPRGPRPQGPRPDGFKGPQGPRGPMTLFKFDANKDGVVTKDELPKDNKFVEGMFDRTDADKDGKVTKEEEDAHKAELQKRYEQRKANGAKPGKPGKSGKKPAPEKK